MDDSLISHVKETLSLSPYPNIDIARIDFPHVLVVGEGNVGEKILQTIINSKKAIEVVGYVSLDDSFTRSDFTNVISLEKAMIQYAEVPVILATKNNFSHAERLHSAFSQVYLYREGIVNAEHNIELMADEASKNILEQHNRMLWQNIYINGFSEENGTQYEHAKVHVKKDDAVLCIGPYYGNPLKAFEKTSNGQFTAHCLEANPYVYAELCKNIMLWQMQDKVVPVCAGVWEATGMVPFMAEGHTGGGNVSQTNEKLTASNLDMAIYAYTVDDYVGQSGFKPTVIESGRIGIAEQVIKGAEQTIKSLKPDLILLDFPHSNTPSLIKAIEPSYRIYYSEANRINYGVFFASVKH